MSTYDRIEEMRKLWNSRNKKSKFGFISYLQPGQEWDSAEFHLTGIRFVDRMVERFCDYGEVETSYASILEIGCGVGRFLKPLGCRFRKVTGVDVSKNMLKTAKKYCACLPNVSFVQNDGSSLAPIPDSTYDYCVSAGVFQHITDMAVILDYIREALRILKPRGVFLFNLREIERELLECKTSALKLPHLDSTKAFETVVLLLKRFRLIPATLSAISLQ